MAAIHANARERFESFEDINPLPTMLMLHPLIKLTKNSKSLISHGVKATAFETELPHSFTSVFQEIMLD